MLTDFDKPIITNYSPISARGGKRRRSRKLTTRRYKRSKSHSKNTRTRRRYR
jgi:hypothetical protein